MSSRPEPVLLRDRDCRPLRRDSSETTLSEGHHDDRRESRYQWRTTWTAPTAQTWVPGFVTFDDHINRRFYSSCQMLEPEEKPVEIPPGRGSSSIFRRRRRAFSRLEGGEDEEPYPREADAAQGEQYPGATRNTARNAVGFFSPIIRQQRKEVLLAYLKTR